MKPVTITFRCSEGFKNTLLKGCEQHNRSQAQLIELAVKTYLNADFKEVQPIKAQEPQTQEATQKAGKIKLTSKPKFVGMNTVIVDGEQMTRNEFTERFHA